MTAFDDLPNYVQNYSLKLVEAVTRIMDRYQFEDGWIHCTYPDCGTRYHPGEHTTIAAAMKWASQHEGEKHQ